ncbi:MAG: TRAP transporter small permease [Gammaproteobacteria bacterium]
MLGRLAQICHVVSAFWVVVLAVIIFIDVSGRFLFNTPLLGAVEIIKNSVVSITFLQLPLAIYRGGMIRTTIIYGAMGPTGQRTLRSVANILGLLFFLGIAYSSWGPALEAWHIGEYEGEGALRIATYPIRFLVALTSIFSAYVYLHLLFLDWMGRFHPEDNEIVGV